MALQAIHDRIDDIPEQYRDLYAERGGRWELTGITGVRTQADVDRMTRARDQERAQAAELRERLAAWGDLDHEEVMRRLDRIAVLETAAAGRFDEAALRERAHEEALAIVRSQMGPVERRAARLAEELARAIETVRAYERAERVGQIRSDVTAAALDLRCEPWAIEDITTRFAEGIFERTEDGRTVTRDGVGCTPGLSPREWLEEMQPRRPAWWPPSVGGGARGGGTGGGGVVRNPYSHEHWSMTEQALLERQGIDRARRAAQLAGYAWMSGVRPPPRR